MIINRKVYWWESAPFWFHELWEKVFLFVSRRIWQLRPLCAICGIRRSKYYWFTVLSPFLHYGECEVCYARGLSKRNPPPTKLTKRTPPPPPSPCIANRTTLGA